MISAVVVDYTLLHPLDGVDFPAIFLELLEHETKHEQKYPELTETIRSFLSECENNNEFVNNFSLLTRSLAKTYKDAEVAAVLDYLKVLIRKMMKTTFKAVRPQSKNVFTLLSERHLSTTLLVDPYFEVSIATELLTTLAINPNWFDHITSAEYSHYGKTTPRFFYEVAERHGCHLQPRNLLLITADPRVLELALKLDFTIYFVGETDANVYQGNVDQLLHFIRKIPKALTSQI